MSEPVDRLESDDWVCARCRLPLEPSKINVGYLDSAFPVELPRCPRCGLVLISEELATGKMAEVEKQLEDK